MFSAKNLNPISRRTWNHLKVNGAEINAPFPSVTAPENIVLHAELSDEVTVLGRQNADLLIHTLPPLAKASVADEHTAWVSANYNSGFYLEIPAGVELTKTLHFTYELNKDDFLVDDTVIVSRRGSKAVIVFDYQSPEAAKAFHSGAFRAYVEAGASLHVVLVQRLADVSINIAGIGAQIEEAGQFEATLIEIGASETINGCIVSLNGKEAQTNINCLYLGDKNRSIDLNHELIFSGKKSVGRMNVRGVLLDESEKTYRGTLDFLRGASGADGAEEEFTTLLSPKVKNRSIPLLLCQEDNVAGQHATSIGKADEAKLFYLMSRGLSELEAKKLIIEASFRPILDKIPVQALQEEVLSFVRRRIEHV